MEEVIGIDSVSIIRSYDVHTTLDENGKSIHKSFKTLLGAAVSTKNYDKFKEAYDTAISESFDKLSIPRVRRIYCSYDLNRLSGGINALLYEEFFKRIKDQIDDLNIIFTLFKKDAVMKTLGNIKKRIKRPLSQADLPFDEILNKLAPFFPMVCAWRLNKMIKENNSTVLLDGITPVDFNGLVHLKGTRIKILFSGDRCDPLIATADIILTLTQNRLKRNRLWYGRDGIKKIFKDLRFSPKVHVLNERTFKFIAPLDTHTTMNDKIGHPIVFAFKERNEFINSDELKNSDEFISVYNFAAKNGFSVKFYKQGEDLSLVKKGDYLIYLTEEGKRAGDILNGMGKEITLMSLKEISSKYKEVY